VQREAERLKKASTSKAPAITPAISGILTTTMLIFLFVLWLRTLLVTDFLLRADRNGLSEAKLVLGPRMTEEIEGAL
jgi:hypothetical protein